MTELQVLDVSHSSIRKITLPMIDMNTSLVIWLKLLVFVTSFGWKEILLRNQFKSLLI